MATIHQALQGDNVNSLGPLTVKKVFPPKSPGGNLYLVCSDGSGETGVKIWNHAAGCGAKEGDVITIITSGPKASIKKDEYGGKITISCNDCRVEFAGQQAPGQAQTTQSGGAGQIASQAATGHSGDNLEATAARAAKFTAYFVDQLVVNNGFTREEAITLSTNAGGYYPLWWFGEKGLTH